MSVEAGMSKTIDLSAHFTDPNGDDAKLKYTVSTSSAATATATVSGKNLTVKGIKAGMANITVTATDGEGLNTKSTSKVTVTAAPQPTEPTEPSENMAPTVSALLPQTLSAMTGDDPLVVDVAPFFTDPDGDVLTFSNATSTDAAVATVVLSGSTLTITAVAAGTSTISVTATDPDGLSVTGSVTVNVTVMVTDPETTITITDKMKVDIDLTAYLAVGAAPADYELESSDTSVFTVARKSVSGSPSTSVWQVSPVSKGTAMADIVAKADGMSAETLTVIVENRAPELSATAVAPALDTLTEALHMRPTGSKAQPLMNEGGNDVLNLYSIDLSVAGQFKDPDAADNTVGKLTYKITPSRADVIVQDGSTCTPTATLTMCKVWVDIVQRRASVDEFNLNVVAEDPDKAASPSVSFPVRMENPADQTYSVAQFMASNNFRKVTVGYRAGTEHKFVFEHPDTAGTAGFLFAQEYVDDLDDIATAATAAGRTMTVPSTNADPNAPAGVVPVSPATRQTKVYYNNQPLPALADLADEPDGDAMIDVYTVKTTGRVKVAARKADMPDMDTLTFGTDTTPPAAAEDADLVFTVEGVGQGTVEIGYHVWWDADGDGPGASKWHSATKTLTVTVVAVD